MRFCRALCDLANLAAFVVETAYSNRSLEISNIGGLIEFKVVQRRFTIFPELESGAVGKADFYETAITGQQDITAINSIPLLNASVDPSARRTVAVPANKLTVPMGSLIQGRQPATHTSNRQRMHLAISF